MDKCFIVYILKNMILLLYMLTATFPFGINCCDLTWVDVHGGVHCYNIIPEQVDDFFTGRHMCYEEYQGGVVTVTSQDELNAVNTLMESNSLLSIWLGIQEYDTLWQWDKEGTTIYIQGCFVHDSENSKFQERNMIQNNTYAACSKKCQQYSFAALQNGIYCWCGNSFNLQSSMHSDECGVPCPGNQNEICGGPHVIVIIALSGGFSNWLPGQPNNHLGYQVCAEMDPTTEPPGQWLDVDCTDRRYPLCVIDREEICQELQMNISRTDVYISNTTVVDTNVGCYLTSTSLHTRFDSSLFCSSFGGKLIDIKDEETNQYVADFILSLKLTLNGTGMWLNLQRSTWHWDTGEEFLFTNWEPQRPNSPNQKCATSSLTFSGWDDAFCTGVSTVVCEKDSNINYETTSMSQTTRSSDTILSTTITTKSTENYIPKRTSLIATTDGKTLVKGIDDVYLAIVIAVGGFVIVTILLVSVTCAFIQRAKRRKLEDELESKAQKYYYGLEEQIEHSTVDSNASENYENRSSNPMPFVQ